MTTVRLEREGRVAFLTLDRAPVNALSSGMYADLRDRLDEVASADDVSVVVVQSASSRVFCAGADVKELGTLTGDVARAADSERQVLARGVFDRLLDLPQPTIAVLDGPAIGAGAVIASCCDIRIASARTTFQLPEVDVGRCGGARHMMRHLPQSLVRRMYFSAESIDAGKAEKFGFVQLVPEGDSPADAAVRLARTIAEKSPAALRLGKRALNESESLPVAEGYAAEQQYTLKLARTADAAEALLARREGRAPRFTGD
ncbi:enoyl-CoA hydratase-related protein [Rhodococcus wratislaviensis]|uniref:Putative enoyl-CoA hydratase n=1 Tax=Rhodococcus wratislaviensis NBRC 100605 TaxID=1219028 RepID=X0Q9L1_RHOWR|nr:enoyl-CoA hydratase-related protein [Rhodococcus wratislaviensis]GAF47596.1 putative enoyl-CoA hydratase [Rhodococcus wratislaviensis NBRC 100605]